MAQKQSVCTYLDEFANNQAKPSKKKAIIEHHI